MPPFKATCKYVCTYIHIYSFILYATCHLVLYSRSAFSIRPLILVPHIVLAVIFVVIFVDVLVRLLMFFFYLSYYYTLHIMLVFLLFMSHTSSSTNTFTYTHTHTSVCELLSIMHYVTATYSHLLHCTVLFLHTYLLHECF